MLSQQDMAPDFNLPADPEGHVSLSGLRGHRVVIYFYPKDDTSGCTQEAIEFNQLAPEFAKAGIEIIGISPDSETKHRKFKQKHGLSLRLAADGEKQAANAYGVWVEKSMYGRKYWGVERSTFLVGPDGRLERIWRKVKVPGHAAEVLAAAKACSGAGK